MTTSELYAPRVSAPRSAISVRERVAAAELQLHRWLVAHAISILRIAMGAVFLGFGVLKYVPGGSPAENLAVTTTRILTFGLVPDTPARILVATLECAIGAGLITGRLPRLVMILLALEIVGILSPTVLLAGRMFAGPHHFPTLEGQYVLKDVILLGAALVLAAVTTGARLVARDESTARTDPAGSSIG